VRPPYRPVGSVGHPREWEAARTGLAWSAKVGLVDAF